jgi:hypothetical protein
MDSWRAGCGESRTSGSEERVGETTGRKVGNAPRLDSYEWAKRQARRGHLSFSELANGFAACAKSERLQAICNAFGPDDVQAFFDRWITHIPNPFTRADRAAGYWWELSMRQVEVSRTLVFDDPRRARGFFEALVADNVGIGRPQEVAVVFARQVRKTTKEPFSTRVFCRGPRSRWTFATSTVESSST